jgi:hypothetical protein
MPRGESVEALVQSLLKQHAKIRSGLQAVEEAASREEMEKARTAAVKVRDLLRIHTEEEEGRLLVLINEAFGEVGASDAVAVFKQHSELNESARRLADSGMSHSDMEVAVRRLGTMFHDHTRAEEGRIFPCARGAHPQKAISS